MVSARDVDFNSPWASLPAVVGPVAHHDPMEMDEEGGDRGDDLENLETSQQSCELGDDADSQNLCGYCSTLTWSSIRGHIQKRAHLIFKQSFGDMVNSRGECKLCRVLVKCIEDANPAISIDPTTKLFFSPVSRDRRHQSSQIYALAVNPTLGGSKQQQKKKKHGVHQTSGLEAGVLAVFMDENDAPHGPLNLIGSIAGRQVRRATDLTRLKSWFSECRTKHAKCKDNSMYRTHSMSFANDSHPRKVLPKRTVFIPEDENDPNVYLQEHGGEREDYIALSYCWGKDAGMIRTTSHNREAHLKGLEISSLPKTFRDAIHMTRELGVYHLWIDALCIIQDDKQDWANEARNMGRLYAGSVLTIAALSSTSAEGGLFFERDIDHDIVALPYCDSDEGNGIQVYLQASPSVQKVPTQLEEEAHSKRAWTLQERLISPRVIHCAQLQYYWECREVKRVEDGSVFPEGIMQMPKDRPGSLIGSLVNSRSRREALDLWYEVVRTYSWRHLTFESDKLTALGGLVKTFAPYINANYVDGIWATDLSQALAWRRSRRCPALIKPDPARAASWSWAAYDGGINYLNQRVYYNRPPPAWRSLLERPVYSEAESAPATVMVTGFVYTNPAAKTIKDLLGTQGAAFLDDGTKDSSVRPEDNLCCLALAEAASDDSRAHLLLLAYDKDREAFSRIGVADVRNFRPLKANMSKQRICLV